MAKKVYTIDVENENLTNTAKSKAVQTKKSLAEKEVESFGIEQINNASSKAKVKNTNEVGFQKTVTKCSKKSVKTTIHNVEDYFDFSFRKEEPKAEEKAKVVKASKVADVVAKTEPSKKPASVCKMKPIENTQVERRVNIAESCERLLDEEANRIVCIARMGTLFG